MTVSVPVKVAPWVEGLGEFFEPPHPAAISTTRRKTLALRLKYFKTHPQQGF
jgi:hypothetical protein